MRTRMKEEVIAEDLLDGSDKIIVYLYDVDTETIIGGKLETTTRKKATKKYNIVAEIVNGEIRTNDNLEQEDYGEFFTGDDYYDE